MDHRFEELKRYNISEIFDPTPKEEAVKEDKAEAQISAEVEAKPEVVPTAIATTTEDKSGVAVTDEVSVDDDKAVAGDGGVSLANDDATGRDKDGVSAVKD